MQEETLQPITVGAFYGVSCPRPFLLKTDGEQKGGGRKKVENSPYCALPGQNEVFLGTPADPERTPAHPRARNNPCLSISTCGGE